MQDQEEENVSVDEKKDEASRWTEVIET